MACKTKRDYETYITETIIQLSKARDAFNRAANKSVGSQQAHLTAQWACMNDMMQVLLGDRSKMENIVKSAEHWDSIT